MEDVLLAFVLTFSLVGIPTIAFTATRIFKQWLAFKERQLEATTRLSAERAERGLAAIDDLHVRVQVLERIATDRTTHLAHQIEGLREERRNEGVA